MSKRVPQETQAMGNDSFLDIVANMVGILIILVVVAGLRVKDSPVAGPSPEPQPKPDTGQVERLAEAQRKARSVEADVARIVADLERHESILEARKLERSTLAYEVSRRKAILDKVQSALDDNQRKLLTRARELAEFEAKQVALERELVSASKQPKQVVGVEHLPTPMSKTVYGDEVHLRLQEGLITPIPMDDLLQEIKSDLQRHAARLRDGGDTTSLAGPIDGFRLKYRVARHGQLVQVTQFILVPMKHDLGDPLADAFRPGSHLMRVLNRHSPKRATITVWVYPHSFAEFRQLKKRLFEMGYAVAARPLPEGEPISGSPYGTRSAAQ